MGEASEARVQHLELIQGVIGRMGQNSFLLKGWSVTLVTALIALAAVCAACSAADGKTKDRDAAVPPAVSVAPTAAVERPIARFIRVTGTNLDKIDRVRFDLESGKVHQMTPQQAT